MANLFESPSGTSLGQRDRLWFEQRYAQPPKDLAKSAIFGRANLVALVSQPRCVEFVFSKQQVQNENKTTLAVAGVDAALNLLADDNAKILISNLFEFPKPANATVKRDDFQLNKAERTQDVYTFSFQVPESNSNQLDNLIDRFRSFSQEANVNFFLTSKFKVADLQSMLNDQTCDRIAFVPIFIKCDEEAEIDRNGTTVIERSTSYMETLAAMALDNQGNLIMPASIKVTSESWPKPYPPYGGL